MDSSFTRVLESSLSTVVWPAVLVLVASCVAPLRSTVLVAGVGEIESEVLSSIVQNLRPSLAAVRRAAPGLHPLSPGEAPVGRTYRVRMFRLVDGPMEAAVRRMLLDFLRPDPSEIVFYADAERSDSPSSETYESALTLRAVSISGAEMNGIEALSQALAENTADGRVVMFLVEAGWADAVGAALHGVVIVDPVRREALWLHVFEVWTV